MYNSTQFTAEYKFEPERRGMQALIALTADGFTFKTAESPQWQFVKMTEIVGMVKSMGADALMKSESPAFIECEGNPTEKLYQLALVAKQLLKGAVEARANTVNQKGKKPNKG
jgi:hypothetical protein